MMFKKTTLQQPIRQNRVLILLNDVLQFVRQPVYDVQQTLRTREKVINTAVLLLVKIMASLTIALVMGAIYDVENQSSQSLTERFSPFAYLLLATLFFPLLEEATYRLSLKFKPSYLAITIGAATYTIVTKVVYQTKHSDFETALGMRLAVVAAAALITYLIVSRAAISQTLAQVWQRHFRVIYYVTAVAFAWVHIFNFELSPLNLLLMPLITLPQLISGFLVGYVRVNYGFIYNLASHGLTNLLFTLLAYIPLD